MLNAIKNALAKNKQNNHARTLKIYTDLFMESIVCSVKSQDCCEGNCLTYVQNDNLNKILSILSEIEGITYWQWIREKECYVKREFLDKVAEVVTGFKELSKLQFRFSKFSQVTI